MVSFRFIFIVSFLCGCFMHAQSQTNLKQKYYFIKSDTLFLDTLSLMPGTIRISAKNNPLDSSTYRINYPLKAIIFKVKPTDPIFVSYKSFPYNFEKSYYHQSTSQLTKDLSLPANPLTLAFAGSAPASESFVSDGLNKNGSISRGISFGNNQDVVVNSSLNLQVSGKLTQEVDLLLAATDDNIPFQADGTTAQLQEFDKVFVQLSNKNSKLIVGDFQLQRPNSYFMNFYKRSQGAYFANNYYDTINKKTVTFKTQVSGAVSKGKFARNIIQGVENNQGPYRLHGADNEQFIIVLSGTERIYVDGRQLQRGQENDYIIDYNTAEITFTAKQIITKDKRIIAEFQYAERNYARSLYFFSEEIEANKLKVRLNFFGEQDNKNKTLQQSLTDAQKLTMFNIGDTLSKAVTSGAELVAYNSTDVFYWKKDTVVSAIVYQGIYVNSTNPDSAKYRVKFSYVGENNGYYIQVSTTANGKVYKWVAPVGGVLQGNYEPIIPLVTPKKKQMFTAGANYEFNKNHVLDVEGVYTKNDINTFSKYNSGNDDGYGLRINSNNQSVIKKDTVKKESLSAIYNLSYEYVQQNFNPIERYRAIEFERDWNRPTSAPINTDQHVGLAQVGIQKNNRLKLLYGISFFDEGVFYKGLKHSIQSFYNTKTNSISYNGSYLTSDYNSQLSNFYRHKTSFSQSIGRLKFNYLDEFEQNKFRKNSSDSLLPRSYQFWEWEGNITNKDTTGNLYKLFYRERRDKQAYRSILKDSTYAKNMGFSANINSIRNHPFSVIFTYRELKLKRDSMTIKPDNTLLSRVEYSPRMIKGFITSSMFYETGYGLENKKEYYYLLVAAGQGTYAWKDYNNNGIAELNEFEIAQFSDQALYIRVYTPTNQYVKVLHDQFSFSLNLRPAVFLKDSSGKALKFISRFASQSVYRVDKKSYDEGKLFTFNPVNINLKDSFLTALNYSLRQSLFFNQSAAVFGTDYTYQSNLSKQLLTNGYETRENTTHEWRWRWNVTRSWSLNSTNIYGIKSTQSLFLSTRNYKIESYDLEQKLSYQPNTAFRVSLLYKHNKKQNIILEGFEKAELNDVGLEFKFNQVEKGSITGKADFITISYNAEQNTPVAYEMLNALKTGYNYTWEISYQRNLTNNIQISINYNGRKSPNSKIINIGGAQVRAFF
ncbi:MAG: hypothetical protein HY062_09855 [Bacteroidetes bacterium]|nr:hypothetical protein [Bacteroidota bacterium]